MGVGDVVLTPEDIILKAKQEMLDNEKIASGNAEIPEILKKMKMEYRKISSRAWGLI